VPFVPLPGLTVHYECAGEGKSVLLLVHGNFASWRWWSPLLQALPPGVRAYAPDLRGFGDTLGPGDGCTVEGLVTDLARFVEALELPPVHVVGHSLGGAVALECALRHPSRFRSVTLISPAPADGLHSLRDSVWKGLGLPSPFERVGFHRVLQSLDLHRSLLRRALRTMAPGLDDRSDAFQGLVNDATRVRPETVVGLIQSLDVWNVEDRLDALDLPVLVLWGTEDRIVQREPLQRMVDRLPRAELVVWEDVGHAPQLEAPERFHGLLLEFIGRKGRGVWGARLRLPDRQAVRAPHRGWGRLWWRKLAAVVHRLRESRSLLRSSTVGSED